MEKLYDALIIGGGPAGLAAAIYSKRGGLDVAVVEKGALGGLASLAAEVENYPGIKSASGLDICFAMAEQCNALGVRFIFDQAVKFDLTGDVKRVTLAGGDVAEAKNIILTVGARPRRLDLEGEERLTGKGISYCATCDGALFRGKTVAVVGGGNTAVEDALYLEKLAAKVYLIHRRDKLRADKILADRIEKSAVRIIWDSVVTELVGENKLSQITLKNVKTDALTPLSVDGVFVAIGQAPATEGLDGIKTESGYIVTDEAMRTNISGVYAAGDIRQKSLRQIVTACADGAIAADSVIKSLQG